MCSLCGASGCILSDYGTYPFKLHPEGTVISVCDNCRIALTKTYTKRRAATAGLQGV